MWEFSTVQGLGVQLTEQHGIKMKKGLEIIWQLGLYRGQKYSVDI